MNMSIKLALASVCLVVGAVILASAVFQHERVKMTTVTVKPEMVRMRLRANEPLSEAIVTVRSGKNTYRVQDLDLKIHMSSFAGTKDCYAAGREIIECT